jgi:CRP/FNR family transcriptional regulator, anaerobic regulatory protein
VSAAPELFPEQPIFGALPVAGLDEHRVVLQAVDGQDGLLIEEKDRADQLIVDFGRRTADERIARLMLNLAERLSQRRMTRTTESSGLEMEFPLRQHHIADATGLTPVHVSKVLSEFGRSGLIKISDRALAILDPAGFRRVAHMR